MLKITSSVIESNMLLYLDIMFDVIVNIKMGRCQKKFIKKHKGPIVKTKNNSIVKNDGAPIKRDLAASKPIDIAL